MRDAHDFENPPEVERPAPRRPVWPETIEAAEANPPSEALPEQESAGYSPLNTKTMRAEIVAGLQARELNLDRRARGLAEQLAALAQAQRNQRLAQQPTQEELRLRESAKQCIKYDP